VEYACDSPASCPDCKWEGKWGETEIPAYLTFCRRLAPSENREVLVSDHRAVNPVQAARLAVAECEEEWDRDAPVICFGVIRVAVVGDNSVLDALKLWDDVHGVLQAPPAKCKHCGQPLCYRDEDGLLVHEDPDEQKSSPDYGWVQCLGGEAFAEVAKPETKL
jgi:hypothetical protein